MGIVLVTGGAGFVGSHLVDRLLESGAAVRVLDNLSTGSLRNLQRAGAGGPGPTAAAGRRLEVVIGDIRDERIVRKVVRGVADVFHLAALPGRAFPPGSAAELHSVNAQGTLNILQAAAAEGVRRVVLASCGSVYGPAGRDAVSEDDRPRPASLYAASRLAAEIYGRVHATGHGLEMVILRYFSIYGPCQLPGLGLVPALVDSLRRGQRPVVDADARRPMDLLHVQDAVTATLAARDRSDAAGLTLNVASGQPGSAIEILDILNRLLRTDLVPRQGRSRATTPGHPRVNTALARRVLAFAPAVSLVEGLSELVRLAAGSDAPADPILAEVISGEERADV